MSKRNDDFFAVKKDWSRVKDTLLGAYLPVYFSKVIHTRKPIVYIDCFAGAGKFKQNDEDGSPRIALKARRTAIENSTFGNPKIDMYFIEPIHAEELRENIADYPSNDGYGKVVVIKDTYENAVPRILSEVDGANVFLYVDPFGIKSLGNRIFVDVCERFNGSVELLLNLNSFGFIREACRVVGTAYNGDDFDLEERDSNAESVAVDDGELLTAIAGGDYWKRIIDEYRSDTEKPPLPSLKAENTFSTVYKSSLSKAGGGPFQYVLDIPIRIKQGSHPKYRMVYATNHPDGCIAMADNMIHRAEELYRDIQSGGQLSLFECDVNQDIRPPESLLRDGVLEVIRKRANALIEKILRFGFKVTRTQGVGLFSMRLNSVIANFFCVNGVVCSRKDIVDVLKKLESEHAIEVSRQPAFTARGTPTRFWNDDKGNSVSIRIKETQP